MHWKGVKMAEAICEVWHKVPGYEGLYEVSSLGQVRSLYRYKKILKPQLTNNGYLYVQLFKNKIGKNYYVHRLVANAFIPKVKEKPFINHKDEIKTNNAVSNLEWISHIDNCNYGSAINRRVSNTDYNARRINNTNQIKAVSKPIAQYTKDGIFLKRWNSAAECAREYGFSTSSCIRKCVNGERKTAFGFVFKEWRDDLSLD